MIPTDAILTALAAHITSTGLVERVERAASGEISAALRHLRDSSESAAIILPAAAEFSTEFIDGTNHPLRTDVMDAATLFLVGANLERRAAGDAEVLHLHDALLPQLLWVDLGLEHLLTIPTAAEPIALEWDDGNVRSGWRIDLQFRYSLFS
jgi:hypothetical protein